MTKVLLHYNGHWTIARPGVFYSRVEPTPVAAWYAVPEDTFVCLCGEENVARVLDDPSDREMVNYAKAIEASREGMQTYLEHCRRVETERRTQD
jgi:hypothetical protein